MYVMIILEPCIHCYSYVYIKNKDCGHREDWVKYNIINKWTVT